MPEGFTATLIAVLGLAVLFDYINGFHDTANAIATSVATRVLYARTSRSRWRHGQLRRRADRHGRGQDDRRGLITPQADGRRWSLRRRCSARSSGTCSPGGSASRHRSSHALIGGLSGAGAAAVGFGAWQIGGIWAR